MARNADITSLMDESEFDSPETISKKKKALEEALQSNSETGLQKRNKLREVEKLSPEDWKAKYGSKYSNNVVEDMSERLAPSIDEFKKAARLDKLKSLAKGAGSIGKSIGLGMALEPSDIANSEMPMGDEDAALEAQMKMKNAPYNYPTKFGQIRKLLGK